MRTLFRKAGRAWFFITNNMPGEHFVLKNTTEVKDFLNESHLHMQKFGDYGVKIYDIEGCFPNMPKPAIELATMDLAKEQMENTRGVWVPQAKSKPCRWYVPKPKKGKKERGTFLPWEVLSEVLTFSLHNAFVQMPDGKILHQEKGIPMGDPMSPAMTIGTCGWMEREWMSTLTTRDKISFRARRYMDDILLFHTKHPSWNHEKFLADFLKSECYWKPLKLESAANNTFLETNFSANQWELSFRLKNPNEETRKVWRYHDYKSCIPYSIKRQVLLCTLKKIDKMASNPSQLRASATPILKEFQSLHYPTGILKFMCSIVARDTQNRIWLDIREEVGKP